MHSTQLLMDSFSRSFSYLRLSLTEKCNFKCIYCLPNGSECHSMDFDLTLQEIGRVVRAFAQLGTKKIRLTGGEPTLRKDLCDIIQLCKDTAGIESVALTTNGFRLEKDVASWHASGLDSLNVSVDSLQPDFFRIITGTDKLKSILNGLETAEKLGFKQLKINSVLLHHQNPEYLNDFLSFIKQRRITLRFIELMRTGDNDAFFSKHHISGEAIRAQLISTGWKLRPRDEHAGPAEEFHHPDYTGGIGLILPYSGNFCDTCNRLRVSSKAELFLCLFAENHLSFRELLQTDDPQPVIDFLQRAILQKSAGHNLMQHQTGATKHLAIIGG